MVLPVIPVHKAPFVLLEGFFFSLYFGRRDHEGTLRNALDTRQISDTQSI